MNNPFANPKAAGGSFLPEDYVQRQADFRANIFTLSLFAVVLLGVVAAWFVTQRRWTDIRAEQEMINVEYTSEAQKIDQLKALEKQREQMMEKAEITAALIERVPRSVLMAEMITRMPADLTLLEMELKSKRLDQQPTATPGAPGAPAPAANKVRSLADLAAGGKAPTAEKQAVKAPRFESTLRIVGVAAQNASIADFIGAIKQCELLENVELAYINETTIEKVNFRKFEIAAQLRQNVDARAMKPVESLQRQTEANTPQAAAPAEPK